MKLPCIIITDSIKEPGWWYLGVYDEKGALLVRTKGNSTEDPYLFIDKLRRAADSEISDNRKNITNEHPAGTNNKD